METQRQRKQTIIASVFAVVAALGLAASVSYAFASTSNQTQTTTSTNYIDCTKTSTQILNLPESVQLKENGTATINGTTYWYVSFIPGWARTNESTVTFHDVSFTLTVPFVKGPKVQSGFEWTFKNVTLLTTKTVGSLSCGYELPPIKITFGDGSSVAYNSETVTIGSNSGTIVFDKPSSNPWFTGHLLPQAGVGYQVYGGQVTLYVSTS